IQNNFCCVSVAYAFTKVYSLSLHDALPISNRATSRLNSRSSVRPTGSPPIPIHTRARARRPAEPPAPAPPPSTALLLPWLQFLKGWSLRQTRGDSSPLLVEVRRKGWAQGEGVQHRRRRSPGQLRPKRVVSLLRNGWSDWTETAGQIRAKRVVRFERNTHSSVRLPWRTD